MKIAHRIKEKFLKIEMYNNAFATDVTLNYKGVISTFRVIIDTGCTHSLIPFDRLYGIVDKDAFKKIKAKSLRINKWTLGSGVETDRNELSNIKLVTEEDKINCKNIKVLERFEGIHISEIYIPSKMLYISYDYTCNALIGMEILKDWDIHISKSLKTGQTLLLACPLDKINQEYIDVLIEEFDIGQRVIKKLTDKIDYKALEAVHINNRLN